MILADIITFFPIAVAGAYFILLVILFIRRSETQRLVVWLLGFLAISAVWQLLVYVFPNQLAVLSPIPLKLWLASVLCLLAASAMYVESPLPRWLLPAGLGAIVLSAAVDFAWPAGRLLDLPPQVRLRVWLTAGGLFTLAIWLVTGLGAYALTLLASRRTRFPWHANRYVLWANCILLALVGDGGLLIPDPVAILVGHLLRLTAAVGFVYAATAYIRFDVRTRLRHGLVFAIIAIISAIPATAIFVLFISFSENLTAGYTAAVVILITSFAFIFYLPYRRIIERFIYRYLIGDQFQTNEIVRSYNQAVSRIIDVEQLSSVVIGTLSELFDAGRGALMLVTRNDAGFEIEPIPAMGDISRQKKQLEPESPFVHTLIDLRQPILQYEIEFNRDYRPIRRELEGWLDQLEMEIYAPILSGDALTGFISLGPKRSGLAYRANELEAMQLLADQTVVSLQNARLYTALGEQNEKVRHLNEGLRHQNERLEIMDKVKSDFITIASHELRTPLTQVKGYADILAAMNEESALTREQTRQIVGHINRATRRLEELITAMLDASQIDVDEMHMTFTESRMDTVIRLAQEPLAKAMRDRRITVRQEGIDNLPVVYSDFKRLVQCFTNLIGNAVKYTPDGGHVTITGTTVESATDGREYIQIAITDTGIGIDLQYHQLIFEKFFRIGDPQLHSTGSTKFMGAGPGLGLPIAKGVIEGHGGRIWVESEGEDLERMPGSTFTVVLPVRPPTMVEMPKIEPAERPAWLIG